jgi:hypothetical protein
VTRLARALSAIPIAAVGLLLFAGCGGDEINVSELPLRQDFADCSGFTMNDDVSTVDCPDEELRILVSQPEASPVHFAPFRFDDRPEVLTVSASARVAKGGDIWGVGCLASEPGQPGRGYAAVLSENGGAGIMRIAPGPGGGVDGRVPQQLEIIAESPSGRTIQKPAEEHELRIRCAAAPAGAVRVRASIDGGKSITARDRKGIGPYTAAFAIVLTDKPQTDVRFDDVVADAVG